MARTLRLGAAVEESGEFDLAFAAGVVPLFALGYSGGGNEPVWVSLVVDIIAMTVLLVSCVGPDRLPTRGDRSARRLRSRRQVARHRRNLHCAHRGRRRARRDNRDRRCSRRRAPLPGSHVRYLRRGTRPFDHVARRCTCHPRRRGPRTKHVVSVLGGRTRAPGLHEGAQAVLAPTLRLRARELARGLIARGRTTVPRHGS